MKYTSLCFKKYLQLNWLKPRIKMLYVYKKLLQTPSSLFVSHDVGVHCNKIDTS